LHSGDLPVFSTGRRRCLQDPIRSSRHLHRYVYYISHLDLRSCIRCIPTQTYTWAVRANSALGNPSMALRLGHPSTRCRRRSSRRSSRVHLLLIPLATGNPFSRCSRSTPGFLCKLSHQDCRRRSSSLLGSQCSLRVISSLNPPAFIHSLPVCSSLNPPDIRCPRRQDTSLDLARLQTSWV